MLFDKTYAAACLAGILGASVSAVDARIGNSRMDRHEARHENLTKDNANTTFPTSDDGQVHHLGNWTNTSSYPHFQKGDHDKKHHKHHKEKFGNHTLDNSTSTTLVPAPNSGHPIDPFDSDSGNQSLSDGGFDGESGNFNQSDVPVDNGVGGTMNITSDEDVE